MYQGFFRSKCTSFDERNGRGKGRACSNSVANWSAGEKDSIEAENVCRRQTLATSASPMCHPQQAFKDDQYFLWREGGRKEEGG